MDYIKANFEGSFIKRTPYLDHELNRLNVITSFLTTEFPEEKIEDAELSHILNLRHIAKKGTDLSSSGKKYSDLERIEAAKIVVNTWLSNEQIDEIIERINLIINIELLKASTTIHLVRRIKDYESMPGFNYLVHIYLTELEERLNKRVNELYPKCKLNFSSKKTLLLLVVTKRTHCDAIGRLCMQPIFDATDFNPGDKVFLVDDHIQAASFIVSSWVSLKNRGCDILGITSLTAHPYSLNLCGDKQILKELDNIVKVLNPIDYTEKMKKLSTTLGKIGLTFNTMTNIEILSIISILLNENDDNYFNQITSKIPTKSTRVIEEGRYDSLVSTLKQPPLTIEQICEAIEDRIKTRFITPKLLCRMVEPLYELHPSYKLELELQNTDYPLSRDTINEFLELKKVESIDENKQTLLKRPKEVAELLGIGRNPKLLYVDTALKTNYCVHVNNFKFTYEDGTIVDSHNAFYKFFGRTPSEDDEFLENSGCEMQQSRRKGKSINSCIVLDKNKNLFIFPYRASTIHHTFITRGESVFFSGTVRIVDGMIHFINDNSGHYKPHPSSLLILARYLKSILGDETYKVFSNDFVISIFDSSAHRDITDVEKELIKKEFLEIVKNTSL